MPCIHPPLRHGAILSAALVCLALASGAQAQNPAPGTPDMNAQQRQMMSYTPELRQKVMALSPEIKMKLQQIHAQHTRHSNDLTLRQVMQEILSEYQSIAAALATDNGPQAADSARRLADHRIPRGGLLPYMPLDKIDNKNIGVLPAMNNAVEGSALKLAEAADKGDMQAASRHMSDIMSGCVACHQIFRGQPGTSPNLVEPNNNAK
mgnify:FL=1